MAAQDSQSYLSKLSPWGRASNVPSTEQTQTHRKRQHQKSVDHVVTHRHRLSLRHYPRDCPPLRPQWFHAIDVPKRRPNPADTTEEKAPTRPKKYAPFSTKDSKAIEVAYRKFAEDEESIARQTLVIDEEALISRQENSKKDYSDKGASAQLNPGTIKVPVNEDYLFDVDIERRELAPAYWLGPIYDVRRGTWFYQDGNVQRPCDENLALQLEEGYLKVKAWRLSPAQPAGKPRSSSQPRVQQGSTTLQPPPEHRKSISLTPQASGRDLRKQALQDEEQADGTAESRQEASDQRPNTYQLFGAHMGSVVTYQDATTAWLLTDDFMSRMNYSMYSRFAGGGHFGGTKVTRGYNLPVDKPKDPDTKASEVKEDTKDANAHEEDPLRKSESSESPERNRLRTLQRQMSSLLDEGSGNRASHEEELRKRDEREIEEDYKEAEGDEQDRQIDHLILVTHGIGQRLSLRIESVNFVHDVNTFRKTIKAVYADSPDLRALNSELDAAEHTNSRIQVLPICWRHLLDFPKRSLKHNRKEHDLGDSEFDDDEYPSLDDISVEGVPAVRNLITDLALDILLYQSPAYRDHISHIVLEECNRIFHLFMARNPEFKGKISFVGHSLGSAIMFDILCLQGQEPHHTHHERQHGANHKGLKLDFEIEDFYALGSPIGLFQMLKGRTIAGRESISEPVRFLGNSMDDPMLDSGIAPGKKPLKTGVAASDIPASRPKCAQIFNIFHPTDPISYRLEPLISPMMASLKPQPLPYTKRGIFGAPMGQGLTGIGARVSQSMSSMWSSMASSLLTRGLGYTGNEPTDMPNAKNTQRSSAPLSLGAGTNVSAGVVASAAPQAAVEAVSEMAKASETSQDRIARKVTSTDEGGDRAPTLIDAEIETLYSGFRKRRHSMQSDSETRDLGAGPLGGSDEWREVEDRGRKLRREERKLRQLNSNGRVDYAIQEGVFDINLIAAIASHLSYWSDEDVSHFIISQLLSRHRQTPTASSGQTTGS